MEYFCMQRSHTKTSHEEWETERERTKEKHNSSTEHERAGERVRERQRGKTEGKPEFELQFNKCCSCYLFHTHVTRLVFIYATRFHYCALQQLHRIHMYFNFLLFHFTHCATQHTAQHNTAQLFSTLFPLQALCMCVCVYAILLACVCVCADLSLRLFRFALCYFFFFAAFALHSNTYTHTHTLGTRSRTHTREQQQHAGTQRNAAPQDSVFIRDDTGRITALGNR